MALHTPISRTTTVVSTASSSGRLRVTHRLSYLAHVESLKAEEQEIAVELKSSLAKIPEVSVSSRQPPSLKQLSSFEQTAMQKKAPPTSVASRSLAQKSSFSPNSNSVVVAPPIPKLYKRLLRVFKPPTESSDSDFGGPVALDGYLPSEVIQGPVWRPVSPKNSSRTSPKSLSSRQKPVEQLTVILPSAPASVSKVAVPVHRPPESSSFRARLLKKLVSSPNLNTVIYPTAIAPSNPALGSHLVDVTNVHVGGQKQLTNFYCSHCNQDRPEEELPSPYSPLTSDFEHENACPAGQRILERRNGGHRPRASTMPKSKPTRMPTLQSKYGVPGRELGAGTQAQVMLLRVRSSKRARNACLNSEKETATSARASSRPTLSSVDQYSAESVLVPRPRSGSLITTTADEVTPEQREAYQKRLLSRTSTTGLSVSNKGGLIYAIKKFRPPKATETHRKYLKKVCAEFCISTSMDHENIIKTIDLVRDQPGQELLDDDVFTEQEQEQEQERAKNSIRCRDASTNGLAEEHKRDDYRDCNCPRDRSRHVQAMRSAGELLSQSSSTLSSPTSKQHRSIPRRSVVSKHQRKCSTDTPSARKSVVGSIEQQSSPRVLEGHEHRHRRVHQTCHHHRVLPQSRQSEAQLAAVAKKKKQRLEQELRQKEIQRLKQQKLREKQHAKQLRLDQFPEYCMVMEFAPGGDLFNLLTKSYPPISLHEKHCLWRQLVNGVQYMHSMGVAHRDLKPENILIDATGRILKITDFGIANVFKSVGDPNPLPCKGIIGSEPYIAPEEFCQDEYDPRAVDVWACGVIFYTMYYAAMPWSRADRKKDARFARYISDIMAHRYSEAQRRSKYDQRQRHGGSYGPRLFDSMSSSSRSYGSLGSGSGAFGRPHEVNHHRHFPSYQPTDSGSSLSQSETASPTSANCEEDGSVSPKSSTTVSGSPVMDEVATAATAAVPPAVYNTYAYNGHIGGHEFLDRIETPGCRRVLYGILEPDARKRLTIDQVVNDDWVSRIRYCTDCTDKQEQQVAMVFSRGTAAHRYLQLPNGDLHHQHAIPRKVKT
ncbi:serine/threonine-protein kinase HAL4/sat4 [Dissophora ornata]|nr:serine/threonine-protein kinase HAL4/sat4 [Dissophora ornata]